MPEGFRETRMPHLLWRFACFGPEGQAAMPADFRTHALQARRLPPVDDAYLAGHQRALLYLLKRRPRTFDELRHITQLDEAQLCRNLAALSLVGSVVTVARQATSASL